MSKNCTKCGQTKPIEVFQKNARYAGGHHTWCKECKLNSQRTHPETNKRWVTENQLSVKQAKQRYVDNNRDTVRDSKRKWSKTNNKKVLANTRRYQAAKLNATPPWLTQEQLLQMENIYKNCPAGHEVDHEIPLRGKTVTGLHVPWNLRYLLASENRKKSNKLECKN